MKTKASPPFPSASRERKLTPDDTNLKKMLGRAATPLAKVTSWLLSVQPGVTIEERFPGEDGWHRIYMLKKRRLFYLMPKRRDFRFSMVLGDKAIVMLQQGPLAPQIQPLVAKARHYAEGTAFVFDRKSFDPEIAIALLEAKIAR